MKAPCDNAPRTVVHDTTNVITAITTRSTHDPTTLVTTETEQRVHTGEIKGADVSTEVPERRLGVGYIRLQWARHKGEEAGRVLPRGLQGAYEERRGRE